jgi:site-specific DNA-methyltransferase (adenine-specific)
MRVVKPGGHLTAFAAPRNAHRMISAIEDAGFEIRDCLMWLFATGFPKSHDEGEGRGTALKPAYEPIVLARKPMSERTVARNIAKWGTGALNIDACRVEGDCTKRVNHAEMGYGGGNRAERYQTGSDLGRWPANVMHDGSDEIVGALPDSKGQQGDVRGTEPSRTGDANTVCYGEYGRVPFAKRADSGSAARFFYCAKASKAERIGSGHPAVKPLKLMRWLVRLVTPMGGLVLDPFAGTGMTAEAALLEGFRSVLMENEAEYCGDVGRRLTRFNPDAR